MDRVSHVLKSDLGVAHCTGFLLLLELESTFSSRCFWSCSMHKFPSAIRVFSCQPTGAISTPFRSSAFPQIDQIPQILRRVFLTPRAACYQVEWSRLRGKCWFRLCHWRSFTWSRLLTSFFDMALCFPIRSSERKSLKWLQENIEKLLLLNKRRRWFHSSHEKLSLV